MGGNRFRAEEDAVSPVVGVVLLFGISVALAAVTAGVVVGSDDLISSTPQASFEFSYDAGGSAATDLTDSGDSGSVTITHVGGDTIDASKLTVRVNPGGEAGASDLSWNGSVLAGVGTSVTVDADATVLIVHDSDGGRSTVVAQWDGPDA